MKKKHIAFTGGHAATTGLSVIEEFLEQKDDTLQMHWIGVEKAIEGENVDTSEKKVFPALGVSFHGITTGRLQVNWTRHTLVSLFKIPIGLVQSIALLAKIRPRVLVSFGGFASFPVVLAAFFLRIPVVIHEQTVAIGLANKMSIVFAKKILLARELSLSYFPAKKSNVIGNPLRKSILGVK